MGMYGFKAHTFYKWQLLPELSGHLTTIGTIEQDNTKHCIIETVKYLQVDKVMYASVQSFVII